MSPSLRTILLASVSVATLNLNGLKPAAASCVAVSGSISTTCTGPYAATTGSLTITNSGSISGGTIGITAYGATIGTLDNAGTIQGSTKAIATDSTSTVGALSNSGLISGGAIGIAAYSVSIGTLANSGTIQGATGLAVDYNGTIGTLTNTGLITGTNSAILNGGSGTIQQLINDGTLTGATRAIFNYGSIGTLTNNGLMTSNGFAIWSIDTITKIDNSGTMTSAGATAIFATNGVIGTIVNSGLITGNIVVTTAETLTIAGGSNGSVGTFTGLSNAVTITAGGIDFSSGALLLNDNLSANSGTGTVTISGAEVQINRSLSLTGNYAQSGGGVLVIGVSASGNGELVVSGTASLTSAHISITALSGATLTSGETFTVVSSTGTLTATGVQASTDGLYSDSVSISGNTLLVTLVDVGPVTSAIPRMQTLTSGSGSISSSGQITAGTGVTVNGSAASLINSGTITATNNGVSIGSTGSVTSITNSGTISGNNIGIANSGTIGTLTNSGTISGGSYAIYNTGSIGLITDNGVIAGNISSTGQDLTIDGGSNGTVGTLASYSGSGLGTIVASGVVIHSASLLLADQITVGGGTGTVANTGATVQVNQAVSISGNYTQSSSAALVIGVSSSGNGELVVSGNVDLTNGTITIITLSGGTLTYGETLTIVSAGSVADSGLVVSVPNGFSDTISLVNGDLVVTLLNPDPWPITTAISQTATLSSGSGSISNTGTISGVATGVAVTGSGSTLINNGTINASGAGVSIAGTASSVSIINGGTISGGTIGIVNSGGIGTLTNSGMLSGSQYALYNSGSLGLIIDTGIIAGNISSAAQALTIDGGSNGTVGTLTGYGTGTSGTISAPGVVFNSGAVLLDDTIDVGTGMVTNAGASLQLNRKISITGNYTQGSSGALVFGVSSPTSYGQLVISGAASLTNSAITIMAINGASLASGETFTVVSAGTLSATGVTATTSGFTDSVTVTGESLVVTLASATTWTQRADDAGRGAIPVGPVLDTLSTETQYQSLLTQLSSLSADGQTHALRQLNASQLTPQINAALDVTAPTTFAVEQHEVSLKGADGGGRASGSDYQRGAIWGQVLGGHATRDTSARSDGYSASSYGLLFGADIPLDDTITGGVAVSWLRGYSKGKADTAGNTTRLDSYQLTTYGSWRPDGGGVFVEGLLATGFNRYNQKRTIDFLGNIASAQFDGRHYQAKLATGYDIPTDNAMTITPLGSLQVVRVENDAYAESGAGLADLSVHHQGFNTAESELGSRLADDVTFGWGTLGGDMAAAWVHAFTNSPIATSAAMGGVGFVSKTTRPAADGLRLTTGLVIHRPNALSIRLEYDGDFRADYQSHTGILKFKTQF